MTLNTIPRAVFFDLDGTLFVEEEVLPGAVEIVHWIREKNLRVFFVSNNSSRSTCEYLDLLTRLGFSPQRSEIHSALNASIHYLKEQGHQKIFPLALPEVEKELLTEGFLFDEQNPSAVFLTYDLSFTFAKFITAHQLLTRGSVFVASHPDIFCPAQPHYLPDIGCLLSAFNAAGFQPESVVGKPNPQMILPLLHSLELRPEECLMIGDRIQTDMKLARSAGMQKALVLTGDCNFKQARSAGIALDEIFQDLPELFQKLKTSWNF